MSGHSVNGGLTLVQRATGGAGGSSAGGFAGSGGTADSSLTFDDLLSATASANLTGASYATGGVGGAGTGGSNGAAGGQGYAYLNLTGAAAVTAISVASGGAGGAGATLGTPGPGQALITAVGTNVTAVAVAVGGQGASRAGHGKAKIVTTGASGSFNASADTSLAPGALVTAELASSTGSVDGKQTSKAKVVMGQSAQPFSAFGQATADESGAPDGPSTAAVLAANPNIAAGFGASPVFFAIDELGGKYAKSGGTTSETNVETLDLTVDTTKLVSLGHLGIGFYSPTELGSGFTSLTFTLTADGSTVVSQTFTTVAAADAFFTDNFFDLGQLGSGALSAATLNLVATLTITTNSPGSGYYIAAIIGDPPGASAARRHRFVQSMAGMGGAAGGSSLTAGALASAGPSMLAAGRPLPTA